MTAGNSRRWLALVIVLLATFMEMLDLTIVGVAVPAIHNDLGGGSASVQWILAGYQLAFALLLITGGRLGDIVGRRRMFLIGVVGFAAASLLCGLAQSPGMLDFARVLQGLMGGIMVPQVLSIIHVTFSEKERPAALGVYGGVIGVATVSGPLVGGLLTNADLFGWGWRPIFLINVPIGVIAAVGALLWVSESRSPHPLRLDTVGVGLVTVGLLALVYPLVQGRDLGWPTWAFVMMAASVPILLLFGWYEHHKTRANGSPLVDMALFTNRSFIAGTIVTAIVFAGIPGFFLYFVIFLQSGAGFSIVKAALTILPFSVGSALSSGASVPLSAVFGRRMLALGCTIMAAGMGALIYVLGRSGADVSELAILPGMAAAGIGMGFVVPPMINIILAGVRREDAGAGSGVLSTFQQVGGAVGVALMGVIFFGVLGSHAESAVASVAPGVHAQLQAQGVPGAAQDQIVSGLTTCFVDRAHEKDYTKVPPSCQQDQQPAAPDPAGAQQIGQTLAVAGQQANGDNFAFATRMSLWLNIFFFVIALFLTPLLPRKAVAEGAAKPADLAPSARVTSRR